MAATATKRTTKAERVERALAAPTIDEAIAVMQDPALFVDPPRGKLADGTEVTPDTSLGFLGIPLISWFDLPIQTVGEALEHAIDDAAAWQDLLHELPEAHRNRIAEAVHVLQKAEAEEPESVRLARLRAEPVGDRLPDTFKAKLLGHEIKTTGDFADFVAREGWAGFDKLTTGYAKFRAGLRAKVGRVWQMARDQHEAAVLSGAACDIPVSAEARALLAKMNLRMLVDVVAWSNRNALLDLTKGNGLNMADYTALTKAVREWRDAKRGRPKPAEAAAEPGNRASIGPDGFARPNAHGVYTDNVCDVVEIPLAKSHKAEAKIRLVQCERGVWRWGYSWGFRSSRANGGPFDRDPSYKTRKDALLAGVDDFAKWIDGQSDAPSARAAIDGAVKMYRERLAPTPPAPQPPTLNVPMHVVTPPAEETEPSAKADRYFVRLPMAAAEDHPAGTFPAVTSPAPAAAAAGGEPLLASYYARLQDARHRRNKAAETEAGARAQLAEKQKERRDAQAELDRLVNGGTDALSGQANLPLGDAPAADHASAEVKS